MGTLKPAIFQSGGQASQHYIPGAYSRIDYKKSAGGLSSTNNAVIAGDSRGGEPNTLLEFSSLSEARATLRSGPLLDAIMHSFNPGPGFIPQKMAAWRVNPGLQADKDLNNVSTGVVEVLRLIVTHGATASGDLSVVIDGAAPVVIAVLDTDDLVTEVATKIRAGTYPGWVASGTGDVVILTASAVGAHSGANTIGVAATGVTVTAGIVKTTVGVTAGTYGILTAIAWDWGLHSNQVKIKLEAGTVEGKKATVQFMAETAYVVDDILRESLSIVYSGSEASCSLTTNATGLKTFTPTHTDELDILYSNFPTVQDLVNYLNDQTGYSCTALTLNSTEYSEHLDWVSGTNIKTTPVTLYSNVQALIEALETCPWIYSVTYNVTQVGRIALDNITSWEYFTGGTDGAYTTSEWTSSLTLLEDEDVQFVGASSESSSVHALIRTHCDSMNSVTGRKERQFILGGAAGETVDQFITRCQTLNSDSGSLVYPEFQDLNRDGKYVIWWSPAYYAAKLLGMVTCVTIPEPLTNKQLYVLNFLSVSTSNIEKIIKNGGVVGYKNPVGQFVTVRMLTTYQGEELQRCEFSMRRESLYVNKDLRNAVEATFIGRAMTNGLLTDVDSTVNQKLIQYESLGIFNGDPPYWGYVRRVNGDQIIIEFSCYLTPPTNFIFITSHMAVFASTAS
jgi:hypothetical protein